MGKHFIVCVGRQLGSGGRIIGNRMADVFGIKFYDREVLDLAAQESGFDKRLFEHTDEHKAGLRGLASRFTPLYTDSLSRESLFKFQSDAIRSAAEGASCVFVGRCADYVLRDFGDMVSVFITANLADRIKRLAALRGISEKDAKRECLKGDENRATYYNYFSGKVWGSAASYDLCINSSVLGIEGTADVVEGFIKRKLGL